MPIAGSIRNGWSPSADRRSRVVVVLFVDLPRRIAVSAIEAYQRYLSPLKGFCCAYRAHTGRASCSALGLRAIRRHGLMRGWVVLGRRLQRCGVAHRRYGVAPRLRPSRQAGFCDIGCDLPCHGPDCDAGSWICDALSCGLDCSDCGDWGRKKPEEEQSIHLPPRKAGRKGYLFETDKAA